jgi:transcriptional regulator with XRE-family HTH domain
MTFPHFMTAPLISIRQVKAARALLGWSQTDLAMASGISEPTIRRLEADEAPTGDTAARLRAALEKAGIRFIDDGAPGVQLKQSGKVEGLRPEELNASNDD